MARGSGSWSGGPGLKILVGGCTGVVIAAPVLLIFLLLVTQEPSAETGGSDAGVGGSGLAVGSVPAEYVQALTDAGDECGAVSAPLLAAQVDAESSFNPRAVSAQGAEGIAQFVPSTWARWGKDYSGDGRADIWNAEDAIGSQGAYMCHIASMIKAALDKGLVRGDLTRLMLAGYNVGEYAVIAAGGMPAGGAERYAAKITALMSRYAATTGADSGDGGSSLGAAAVVAARAKLGAPYVFGASGPAAYDCSGYTEYAYKAASGGRIDIGRLTYDQVVSPYAHEVPLNALQPGDLVFIHVPGDAQGGWNHVVMFVGNDQLAEEPRPGEVARIMPMSEYSGYLETARRIVDPKAGQATS